MGIPVGDAIMYNLPDGTFLLHDPERVTLMPSEGGKVTFIGEGAPRGTYRVADSMIKYSVNSTREITNAYAYIELEHVENKSGSGNV